MRIKIGIRRLLGSVAGVVLLAGVTSCADSSSTTPAAGSSTPATSSSTADPTAGSARASQEATESVTDGLVGLDFVAAEVTGSRSIAPNSMISLTFVDDQKLSATAGCNTMNGAYTITDGVLNAPLMASTMMACVETEVAEQETWFAGFLAASPTITYAEGTLTLTDGTDTIIFAGAPSDADALQATGWKLTDVFTPSGGTETAVDPTLSAWVRFATGEVAFNNSCNIGGGTAEIAGSSITFGPLRSTLIYCDGPSGAVETAMGAVLQGTTSYVVTTDTSGTRLEIMSADGLTVLGFLADPTVGVDAFPSPAATSGPTAAPTSGG